MWDATRKHPSEEFLCMKVLREAPKSSGDPALRLGAQGCPQQGAAVR